MSSSADPGPSVSQEEKEKKGIRSYLSRARTVVKKEGSQLTRRLSRMVSSKNDKKSESAAGSKDASKLPEGVTRVSRVQLYEERAKQLGERFGLEIKPSEWHQTEGDALRMEKPIRMRVRRTCHVCQATFGAAKECPGCRHVRCTNCVRHPPKRSEEEKEASRQRKAAMLKAAQENPPIAVDWRPQTGDFVLKKPRKKEGQDLVYKKPRQRVRRTCHQCETLFTPGNRKCAKCEHVRCTDCPRDPPKKDKYPFGYPGDEFGPSSIPFYGCHNCDAVYPDGNAADGTECRRCKHPKCDRCPRLKPRKVEPEPDPAVLRSIQEKIAGLKVG